MITDFYILLSFLICYIRIAISYSNRVLCRRVCVWGCRCLLTTCRQLDPMCLKACGKPDTLPVSGGVCVVLTRSRYLAPICLKACGKPDKLPAGITLQV